MSSINPVYRQGAINLYGEAGNKYASAKKVKFETDKLELSDVGKLSAIAAKIDVGGDSDFRVSRVKEAVEAGQYYVSSRDVAQRMVDGIGFLSDFQ